jgi:hypothetical protein
MILLFFAKTYCLYSSIQSVYFNLYLRMNLLFEKEGFMPTHQSKSGPSLSTPRAADHELQIISAQCEALKAVYSDDMPKIAELVAHTQLFLNNFKSHIQEEHVAFAMMNAFLTNFNRQFEHLMASRLESVASGIEKLTSPVRDKVEELKKIIAEMTAEKLKIPEFDALITLEKKQSDMQEKITQDTAELKKVYTDAVLEREPFYNKTASVAQVLEQCNQQVLKLLKEKDAVSIQLKETTESLGGLIKDLSNPEYKALELQQNTQQDKLANLTKRYEESLAHSKQVENLHDEMTNEMAPTSHKVTAILNSYNEAMKNHPQAQELDMVNKQILDLKNTLKENKQYTELDSKIKLATTHCNFQSAVALSNLEQGSRHIEKTKIMLKKPVKTVDDVNLIATNVNALRVKADILSPAADKAIKALDAIIKQHTAHVAPFHDASDKPSQGVSEQRNDDSKSMASATAWVGYAQGRASLVLPNIVKPLANSAEASVTQDTTPAETVALSRPRSP